MLPNRRRHDEVEGPVVKWKFPRITLQDHRAREGDAPASTSLQTPPIPECVNQVTDDRAACADQAFRRGDRDPHTGALRTERDRKTVEAHDASTIGGKEQR